jgi:ABC-2 type transport system permease protein
MKQFMAFTKKEFLEQLRTGKFFILTMIFCLFGIMNPVIAKITPWLMERMSEQLAESGMAVVSVEVNALTSWIQFFKNMPIALIIVLVMFSSIFTAEYQKGTLINVVTKGLDRWKILLSKTVVMCLTWTFGYLISYGITYGYNAYFWDNSIVRHILFAVFCFYFFGLWLITVLTLASTLFRTTSATTLSAGAAFLATYLLGLIPKIKMYVPSHLMESAELLAVGSKTSNYSIAIIITSTLITINIILSVFIFNKKNI